MKASLMLEYIGEAQDARLSLYGKMADQVSPGLSNEVIGMKRSRMPWVAEITGVDGKFGFKRSFLRGNWERSKSNSTGSRGTKLCFILESEKLYEVKSPVSWRSTDKYFCIVSESGDIKKLTETDAKKWLKDH